ncbi:MAG: M50 family metallopeptidase [Clostridiaceae bacterium]|nr:M50 family metallopeptidase [Clostridiaceae bacterium]
MKKFKIIGVTIKINHLLLPILVFSFYFGFFHKVITTLIVITIHELAHAFTSKYYGINILEIELFPFGGVAKTEGYLELDPMKEMIIAIAGPIANFIMLFIALAISHYAAVTMHIFSFFILANLTIALFNLLPILPLDGGRILRAYITIKFGFKKATDLVIKISKVLSILIFFIGITLSINTLESLLLSTIAVFLYTRINIEKERLAYAFVYQIINKKRYVIDKEIMEVKCLTALESITLKKILYEFVFYKYHFITVINNKGEIVAQLTENEILDAIMEEGHNVTLGIIVKKRKKNK